MVKTTIQMKLLVLSFIFFALLGLSEAAEKMELFRCEGKEYEVASDAFSEPLKLKKLTLSVFHIGKRVKDFPITEKKLNDVYRKALIYDASQDPFYGKGEYYILRTPKESYVIFFENDDRSEFTKGKRFAIGKLVELGEKSGVYVGTPYQGASFDNQVLAELKKKN